MINFLLIIGVGFTSLLVDKKYQKYSFISGGVVLALGIIALLGYAIDEPVLHYQVEGFSQTKSPLNPRERVSADADRVRDHHRERFVRAQATSPQPTAASKKCVTGQR